MTDPITSMQNIVIGYSVLGRPITVEFIGDKESSTRIFIIVGQHGDEKYSRKAVEQLVNHLKQRSTHSFYVAILIDANPDGYENNTRRNSESIDLNRDHVMLQSIETVAIHSFVRGWMPKIIIDVHNYPPRRKHLLKKHLILSHDIFVDIPTNPAILQILDDNKINGFFMALKSDLHSKGISCERYTIFQKSGKIRHSTIDIQDARNSLSLRYGAFCIILEGREPLKKDGSVGENRTISSQYCALYSIINWLEKNKHEFEKKTHIPKKNELVPVRAHYRDSNEILKMDLKNSKTKITSEISLKKYSPNIEITKFIEMPEGYVVPNSLTALMEVLKKHGFSHDSKTNIQKQVKIYYLSDSLTDRGSKRMREKIKTISLSDYVVFPIAQLGGRFLALLLEPRSKFGLHRFHELKLNFLEKQEYPILRI
ncbi:MAG: succinylglutamate desuccinylase/aspartoacylase family protein [Nitrosopumilus sp.]|nr:succinylglutamate desuccinylase/aspartoacylase family protein [Nitrosopumilus sp.]